MRPVTLLTSRLVLDVPVLDDAERVLDYCQDPIFEHFLTTPWPYTPEHARGFLTGHVPDSWATGTELTWALRTEAEGPLIGVISLRTKSREVGYWLGADHRGSGYMAEALVAVCDWAFTELLGVDTVVWRANRGNVASAMVARAAGFRNTTTDATTVPGRDGVDLPGWSGERGPTPEIDARASWAALLADGA